jgi:hypothetical protein
MPCDRRRINLLQIRRIPWERTPSKRAQTLSAADRSKKRHCPRTNRLRVSQNPAAILFESGTVDIR